MFCLQNYQQFNVQDVVAVLLSYSLHRNQWHNSTQQASFEEVFNFSTSCIICFR